MAEDIDDSGERTEEPTQQRREDFRRRGQVVQTKEFASVLMLFGTALAIWLLGRFLLQEIVDILVYATGDKLVAAVRENDFRTIGDMAFIKAMRMILPIGGLGFVLALVASLVQVGFLVNEEALHPSFDKINPVNGLRRLFSFRSLLEGFKSLLKVALIIGLMISVIKNEVFVIPTLMQVGIEQILAYIGTISSRMLAGVGFFLLVVAGIDYAFQRWELEKKMRMTKQEVKEELKSREGDPLIRARIRKIQREVATRRMLDAVPKADVVITNPTHLAVVLKYDATKHPAPQLVAKGADFMAEKIKKIAKEHNVPIIENKPLARTLYKTLKIGAIIPREMFKAVAEVLAYVYKLKNKVAK